jgi:hypothetical protein
MWRLYLAAALVLSGLSGWAGWSLHPDIATPSSESTEKSKEKIVKVTTRPDGTVIREERNKQTAKQQEKQEVPAIAPKTKWAVDAGWIPSFPGDARKWDAGVARRVSDTNLWVRGSFRPDTGDASIGVRVEF